MYILATNGPEGHESHLHQTWDYILHYVGSFIRVDDSIEQCSVDEDTHVVLCVHTLLGHVQHSGFKRNLFNLLWQGVVISQPWLDRLLELAKFLHHPYARRLDPFVTTTQKPADIPQTLDIILITFCRTILNWGHLECKYYLIRWGSFIIMFY